MVDNFESEIDQQESEADRKAREFRKLQEARVAIDQRLERASEKSAYHAWCRLTARTTLMHAAQALGDSASTMKRWMTECCDTVSDEVSDPRISSNARRRLQSVFLDVAQLYGWTL
jgi:hypothetical protein